MEKIKAQVERVKFRLGFGPMVNLNVVLSEIDSILQVVEQKVTDPKPIPKARLYCDYKNVEDPIHRFWYQQYVQLRRCGFPERPFSRDVQLECKDGVIEVHSVILVAASPFFREILKTSEDATIVYHLSDWTRSDLAPVVDLLYTGRGILPYTATGIIWNLLGTLQINIHDISLSPAKSEDLYAPSSRSTCFAARANPQSLTKTNNISRENLLESANAEVTFVSQRTRLNQPPCSVLEELCPRLKYACEPSGSEFAVKAFFEASNKWYLGIGSSKKAAKNNCASQILEDFGVSVKYQASVTTSASPTSTTSLNKILVQQFPKLSKESPAQNSKPKPVKNGNIPEVKLELSDNELKAIKNLDPEIFQKIQDISKLDQNTMIALMRLQSGPVPPKYEFPEETNPPRSEMYNCRLIFDSEVFASAGPSKRSARGQAATQALITILGCDAYSALVKRSRNPNIKIFEPP